VSRDGQDAPEASGRWLRAAGLAACGVRHGFGLRGAAAPEGCIRPRQLHGTAVLRAAPGCASEDADAVVSRTPGLPVAVVTADCVPLLVASGDGTRVAAIHAGWRGLAAGVIERALDALDAAGAPASALRVAVGPHIGVCCYEVDAPVLEAMAERFGPTLEQSSRPSAPGRRRIDLGALAAAACTRRGVPAHAVDRLPEACTRCDAERFASYRRDGAGAGRLVHYVAARSLDNPRGSP